jgi:benzoate transport
MSTPAPGDDLRSLMDRGPMSGHQWGAVALCVLLNVVDGFDILVMAFTANGVTREWGLTGSELGLLLSSGLVGMALGTLFLAPWADRIGRRPTVLACLALVAAGMVAASVSQSPLQLGVMRVLTGLGMGGIIVCANVVAGEFASRRWRGLAVGLNTTGYAFGAAMGGVVAVALQGAYSWRAVFVFGAIMTAVTFVAVLLRMPESPDFLLTSSRPSAPERLARLATRMGFDRGSVDRTPPRPAGTAPRSGRRGAVTGANRRSTVVMCAAFFLTMFGYYFVQSWTPRLLVLGGLSESQANLGGTLLNAGGMAGAVVMGLLASRFAVKTLLVAFQCAAAVLLCAFALLTGNLGMAFVIACVIGLVVNGCMAGMYTLCTALFSADIRATAVGMAITVGRVGAIVAPTVVGGLVDLSWSIGALYALMSVAFVGAAAALSRARPAEDRPVPSADGATPPAAASPTTEAHR